MALNIDQLKPHPKNIQIYGNESIEDIVNDIQKSNWIKPITVSQNNTIISGHRRYYACKFLGIQEIPGDIRIFKDELEELEALLLENANREKTQEQIGREGIEFENIERERAKKRQSELARGQHLKESNNQGKANLPEPNPKETKEVRGQARDIAAEKVGLKSRNYENTKKVILAIDEKKSQGKDTEAKILSEILEKSTDGALKLIKENGLSKFTPDKLDKIKSGNATVNDIYKDIKKQEHKDKELAAIQKQKEELEERSKNKPFDPTINEGVFKNPLLCEIQPAIKGLEEELSKYSIHKCPCCNEEIYIKGTVTTITTYYEIENRLKKEKPQ